MLYVCMYGWMDDDDVELRTPYRVACLKIIHNITYHDIALHNKT